MDELLRRNLFAQVNAYLSGASSLAQLEEWLLQFDPFLVQDPSSETVRLSGVLDLGIVDVNRGHISEDEFKAEILKVLANLKTIIVSLGEPQFTTGGSSNTLTHGLSTVGVAVLTTSS